jgi:hypothetical protein
VNGLEPYVFKSLEIKNHIKFFFYYEHFCSPIEL